MIHHLSYAAYESYAENSGIANAKEREQRDIFQQCDLALAVGPLLRDTLHDLVGGARPVAMLVPGLAEIPVREAPRTFTAFLSGRLSDDATRIKQGHLGIAAFAKAHSEACNSSMPQGLCNQPRLLLRGVDFEPRGVAVPWPPPIDPETELKEFAEEYADRVINLHALPYTQDREELYDELRAASVALMPWWHEGFGLVAWEAIAAGVPLILSQQSGVYRLLDSEFPGAGPGCVHAIDVLEPARQALEILRRLAQTRPDRYEPNYARLLHNYALRLSEVGKSEAGLEQAVQSLAIYNRLAAQLPERFDYDIINAACSMQFLSWVCGRTAIDCALPDPDAIPPTIHPHRRPELEVQAAFVRGCLAADDISRRDAFKRVESAWGSLTVAGKAATRAYWLCAAAWCATHAPDGVAALDWQVAVLRDPAKGTSPLVDGRSRAPPVFPVAAMIASRCVGGYRLTGAHGLL